MTSIFNVIGKSEKWKCQLFNPLKIIFQDYSRFHIIPVQEIFQ